MAGAMIANARYAYVHNINQSPPAYVVDTHHIVVRSNAAKRFFVYASAVLVVAYGFSLFLLKDNSIAIAIWSLIFGVLLVKLLIWNSVEKESVIIMPAFGVQLETRYKSGKTDRCFVPVSKILRPLLNECVTPITCYWSLSLLLRGEEELMLVFKNCRPPMKMLVPIWKALCATISCTEGHESLQEDG